MNTTTNTTATNVNVPSAFSAQAPAFSSKEEYLAFVANWKLLYKQVSLNGKLYKINAKLSSASIGDAKAAHLNNLHDAISAVLDKVPESPLLKEYVKQSYRGWVINPALTGNPKTKDRAIYGYPALATWLLWIRREAKKLNKPAKLAPVAA